MMKNGQQENLFNIFVEDELINNAVFQIMALSDSPLHAF